MHEIIGIFGDPELLGQHQFKGRSYLLQLGDLISSNWEIILPDFVEIFLCFCI